MKELISRWRAKTPAFWNGVKRIALTLAAGATAVWVIDASMTLRLSEWILTMCKNIMAAGAAIGAMAQLTREDNVIARETIKLAIQDNAEAKREIKIDREETKLAIEDNRLETERVRLADEGAVSSKSAE
jgi:hypothetical protein